MHKKTSSLSLSLSVLRHCWDFCWAFFLTQSWENVRISPFLCAGIVGLGLLTRLIPTQKIIE